MEQLLNDELEPTPYNHEFDNESDNESDNE